MKYALLDVAALAEGVVGVRALVDQEDQRDQDVAALVDGGGQPVRLVGLRAHLLGLGGQAALDFLEVQVSNSSSPPRMKSQ